MPVVTAIVTAAAGFLASVGAGAAALVGAGSLVAAGSITATVIGGALVGAAIGGVTAAITGKSILKGALVGGLMGAAVGGALGYGAQALATKATTSGASLLSEGAAGAPMSTQATGTYMGVGEGVSGVGQTVVAEGVGGTEVVGGLTAKLAPAASKGGLLGMSKGTTELLAATGAKAISSALGPDEMELLEKEKELRDVKVGETNRLRPTVDWKKFDYETVVGKHLQDPPTNPTRFSTDNIYRQDAPPKKPKGSARQVTQAPPPQQPQPGLVNNA